MIDINRNSWHYRVWRLMHSREWDVTNLCTYFWQVVLVLVVGLCFLMIFGIFFGVFGTTCYRFPSILIVCLIGTELTLGYIWWVHNRIEKEPTPPSLFSLWLRSKKEKVCPLITFKGER